MTGKCVAISCLASANNSISGTRQTAVLTAGKCVTGRDCKKRKTFEAFFKAWAVPSEHYLLFDFAASLWLSMPQAVTTWWHLAFLHGTIS